MHDTVVSRLRDTFAMGRTRGVVLIIGSWNYPLHLLLVPLVV